MKPVRLFLIAAIVTLAGCGKVSPLEPAAGKSLPVKPAMASVTPDSEQLLTPPSYAKPERIDELMKRSQPRRADRFDLPPPSGEAPTLPQTQEENSSEEAGPATPK
jgi:predicted small lipoprotein YifL